MAGRPFGWSRAGLLQLLLGVNLMVMPPTQARSLRFVTLVMRDGVANGLARARRAQACGWREGWGLWLGSGVWRRRSWFRRRHWPAGLGPGLGIFVEPWGILGGGV